MLPIWFLFAEFFCAGVFFLLDAAFRRCIAGILVLGIFIPGMLAISCFLAGCFFRAAFLLFRDVAFDLGFGFVLLIPGILDMSCWARTETLANNRNVASRSVHTLTRDVKFDVLVFFITPSQKVSRAKKPVRRKTSSVQFRRLGCLGKTSERLSLNR